MQSILLTEDFSQHVLLPSSAYHLPAQGKEPAEALDVVLLELPLQHLAVGQLQLAVAALVVQDELA